jgi:hypothetical protein
MTTSPAELLADAASTGDEVDIACNQCGECRVVFVHHGEDVTDKQAECPSSGCDGEGDVA